MAEEVFALPLLFADVRDQLLHDNVTAAVVFGRREAAKQTNQGPGGGNRVVFAPGLPDGKAGTYEGAKLHRQGLAVSKSKSLGTFREYATVRVWGVDIANPNDEALQYKAARLLHDQVVRAIYRSPHVGHGSFRLSNPS